MNRHKDFHPRPAAPHAIDLAVTSDDVDALGHVNNVVYVRWLEYCAWHHSEALGLSLEDYRRLDRAMVVLRHEIDYLAAAFEGDLLRIVTRITESDERLRLVREFIITRISDGLTLLRARSTYVCIALSSGRARRMPPVFLERYRVTDPFPEQQK
ncbi:MAG: acyl-CoA thioesterase [Pseudomonadota bacterium]